MIYKVFTVNDPFIILADLAWQVILLLTGVSFADIKEVFLQLKTIAKAPGLNKAEKFDRILEFVLYGCAVLGNLSEEINAIHGDGGFVPKDQAELDKMTEEFNKRQAEKKEEKES